MSNTLSPLTEADILDQVIMPGQGDMNPEAANSIVAWKFSEEAKQRMETLASKNNQGTLNPTEQAEMDKYLRVGYFLDLIQAKARLSLKNRSKPKP